MDTVDTFLSAIAAAGLPVPPHVDGDGKLHRFSSNGKRGDDSGWYVLYADGKVPAGAFGDWRTDLKVTWCAKSDGELTKSERRERRRRTKAAIAARDAERERVQAEAAERATAIWEKAAAAPGDHPYLQRKSIAPHGARIHAGQLVVPLYNADGAISSLQYINAEGGKLYLSGGKTAGCYYPLGGDKSQVFVAEGFATGASIAEATGAAVAVCFTAGQILAVTRLMKEKLPDAELAIAADNDVRDDGSPNVGIEKATEAATATGARLAVPELDGSKCDFNDVHVARGLDEVRRQLDSGCSASASAEALLNETRDFVRQFCVFPDEHCLATVTLWAAHAHLVQHFHVTPRLAMLSPEAGSGKTRVLDVLELLVPEAEYSLSASPSSIFRTLEKRQITLLFDEVDAIWNRRGKDDGNEDLRALLNAGYRRGAKIPRCVGPQHDVVRFPVYCGVAMAGLGELPDTIMTRSFIIKMRRRAPGEPVREFRYRKQQKTGHALRDRLAVWAAKVGPAVGDAEPALPVGIVDRPAEIWEPVIAIADAVGGHWPDTARKACVHLCKVAEDRRASLGVRLLADLRTVFRDADALHTETILQRLVDGEGLDDDQPWNDLRGKPLGSRGLASILRAYAVKSRDVKIAGAVKKGYRADDLWDAWQRYLPPVPALALPALPATAHKALPGSGSRVGNATSATASATGSVSGSGSKTEALPPEPNNGAGGSPGSGGSASADTGETQSSEAGDDRPEYVL